MKVKITLPFGWIGGLALAYFASDIQMAMIGCTIAIIGLGNMTFEWERS